MLMSLKIFSFFIQYIGSEKELESRMQQAIKILSHLRFNQFVDANYPVGLLANVSNDFEQLLSK